MNIAIVGATGMVGQSFLKLLEERSFPVKQVKLFASKKNEGKTVLFRSQELRIQVLSKENLENLDIVFFSAGEEISREWAPQAVQAGAVVIDNSAAFRMDKDTALVVPEVNGSLVKGYKKGIIANPNCSTIQLVLALKPLHSHFDLESAHISSYQSLSGAGQNALNQLKEESQSLLNNTKSFSLNSDEHSSAFNCIPKIGGINEEGFSTEEAKLMQETKKILDLPGLKITATAVRVPTFNGHGEAVLVTFKKACNKESLTSALKEAKGVEVLTGEHLPHQRFVDGRDSAYVGRIRAVPGEEGKSWMMWIAADNLRKGAALNGLQIAETLIQQENKG